MLTNKAAIAAIGVVALAGAAATGVFVASRQAEPQAVVTMAEAPADAPPSSGVDATEGVVDATEGVVEDMDTSAAGTPEPAPTPAPVSPVVRPRPTRPVAQTPVAPTPRRAEPIRSPVPSAQARDRSQPATVTTPAEPRQAEVQDRAARPAPSQDRSLETAPAAEFPATRDERRQSEPISSSPMAPQFEEVTVPTDAVIGLQIESSLSSDTARIEDRVEARVARDVRAGGQVAIPAGSRVLGSVSVVEHGGKMRERARLGVRFHTLILADGTEVALQTETVMREGDSPGNASAAKVGGGAIGGAILGAILGGGKGAAIGAGVGAGAGTAAVMAGGRRAAQIQAGSPMTVKVLSPVSVQVEK